MAWAASNRTARSEHAARAASEAAPETDHGVGAQQREALERAINALRRRGAQIRRLAFSYTDTNDVVLGAHADERCRRHLERLLDR